MRVSVVGTGRLRPLQTSAADEIYWIVREAAEQCARRRAQANRLEVESAREARALRVNIRGDGRGIGGSEVAGQGPGISASRACVSVPAQLRAGMDVGSCDGEDTNIEWVVPASEVYLQVTRGWTSSFRKRLSDYMACPGLTARPAPR
jgi:nitrate/nitrite-specific signal transduction histidine kinase